MGKEGERGSGEGEEEWEKAAPRKRVFWVVPCVMVTSENSSVFI